MVFKSVRQRKAFFSKLKRENAPFPLAKSVVTRIDKGNPVFRVKTPSGSQIIDSEKKAFKTIKDLKKFGVKAKGTIIFAPKKK